MLDPKLGENIGKGYQSLGHSILLVGKRRVHLSFAVLMIMFFGGAFAMLIWNASNSIEWADTDSGSVRLPRVQLSSTEAAANSTLFFNPASLTVGNNQQFTLDARINPGANAVSAVELRVTYDQTKFRLDSITASSVFSLELAAASINNTNGTASIALAVPLASPSITATSSIATFSFRSLAAVTASSIAFTTASIASADGESGNAIATRTPAAVTIDAAAPTITNITSSHANGTFSVGEVIPVSVTFSEAVTAAGNVTVTLETGTTDRTCTFTASNVSSGSCNYTVQTGDTSADLTVNSVSGTIADQAGNAMTNFTPATNLAANKAIVIDTTTPVISVVSAIPGVVRDSTPYIVFSSTKTGAIVFGGDCSSSTTVAIVGNNTVTMNNLSLGVHSNCTISVLDASNNSSNVISVASFVVTYTSDLNLDRAVNVIDFGVLKTNYGTTNAAGDINNDGQVSVLDFGILHTEYGGSV